MSTLGWNEIKTRAIEFSKEWENESNEDAEAKSFLDGFFNVFGISRRRVASFEKRVKKENGKDGYIDMIWKGKLLIEMKSKGKSLDRAYNQAIDYFPGLKEHELPNYIMVSDFEKIRLYNLETDQSWEFYLKDLSQKVKLFDFIIGYTKTEYKEQDPVNIKAAEKMGILHDMLKDIGYIGHNLEVYLVRLLFCMFADDTMLFESNQFYDYINNTNEDGSDLAQKIAVLFEILDTPMDKRLKTHSEELLSFPYVNGGLFEEKLPIAGFTGKMRDLLINCARLDWGKISPAIFGAMFQTVMNQKERRNLGAHYTSEINIQKVIKPLFLDELYKELDSCKNNKRKLKEFHDKLANLKFLDPACGCGNFLIIAYRELRLLELEVLKLLNPDRIVFDINFLCRVNVNQFYGIEYEEFPAQIAKVAMWLIDHQMNMLVSQEFGRYFARLPLKEKANIECGNALKLDWNNIVDKSELNYIFGNPPFVGYSLASKEQKKDMSAIFKGIKGAGILDYVTAWYKKSAEYIQNTKIEVAFVSTNSITQGEQISILWNDLFKLGIKINFAHRTFKWINEAAKKAAVHCIIIGFSCFDRKSKFIYEYEDINGKPHMIKAKNINPYLIDSENVVITKSRTNLWKMPPITKGSIPVDGGNLLLSQDEKEELISNHPEIEEYIKFFIGSKDFLNNGKRYCLWLRDISPKIIKNIPQVKDRIENVRNMRLSSKKIATQKLADYPTIFAEIRQPENDYLLIPKVSSENRKYIPIGFMDKEVIASDSVFVIANAELYHFGIITSYMHMIWTKYVCGRMKSDINYSASIVYNNFPWPNPTDKQKKDIERYAKDILDVRIKYKESSLADLYDISAMPPDLIKAHNNLNKAVEKAYGKSFKKDKEIIEFLFQKYVEKINEVNINRTSM